MSSQQDGPFQVGRSPEHYYFPFGLKEHGDEVAIFHERGLAQTVKKLLNDEHSPPPAQFDSTTTLGQVQAEQSNYDRKHWSHLHGQETISHSERHVTKLAGKLATIAEMYDHGETPDLTVLDEEVIPDLLIFAARLANDRCLDLAQAFAQRTELLRRRFSAPEEF